MNDEITIDELKAFKEHIKITDHILVCDQCAEQWKDIVRHYKSGEVSVGIDLDTMIEGLDKRNDKL